MKITWWEKSVEYAFIQQAIFDKKFISPLSGLHEKAGDALFKDKNEWILIEFKRDEPSLSSEEKKFKDYDEAKKELKGQDSHHFLIYGQLEKKESNTGNSDIKERQYNEKEEINAKLIYTSYFSRNYANSLSSMLNHKVNAVKFKAYLDKFIAHKKSETSSGSDGMTFEDYSCVACIGEDGVLQTLMTPENFILEFNANLQLKHAEANTETNTETNTIKSKMKR